MHWKSLTQTCRTMDGGLDLATKGGSSSGSREEVMISVSVHEGRLANDVGYESEPSFNGAFKREFGVPPARFCSQTRQSQRQNV